MQFDNFHHAMVRLRRIANFIVKDEIRRELHCCENAHLSDKLLSKLIGNVAGIAKYSIRTEAKLDGYWWYFVS